MGERQPLYDSESGFRDSSQPDFGSGNTQQQGSKHDSFFGEHALPMRSRLSPMRSHLGRLQLLLDLAAMLLSLFFFIWAYLNSSRGGFVDYGLFSMPPLFIAGQTGFYAAFFPRMGLWRAVHLTVTVIATTGVVFSYGVGFGLQGLAHVKGWLPVMCWWLLGAAMALTSSLWGSAAASAGGGGARSSALQDDNFSTGGAARSLFFGASGRVLFVVCLAFGLACSFFFGWAAFNSLSDPKNMDIGMVTFAVAGVASIPGLYAASARSTGKSALVAVCTMVLGALIIVAGYTAAIILTSVDAAQKLRWGIAMGVWVVAASVVILVALWHRRRIVGQFLQNPWL